MREIKCPECKSKMVKHGWTRSNRQGIQYQLYICTNDKCRRSVQSKISRNILSKS